MHRTSLALIVFAAAANAQDFVFPLGFGSAGGPPGSSYPAARAKDQNGDGVISANEVYAFATVLPTTAASGVNFMTDCRTVVENGEPAFYFTDSEDGQVVRGVDGNHNGVIDPSEAAVFFRFGTAAAGTSLFAPDTLGVWRDPVANRTRVYVAIDNGSPSILGFTRGIHRLIDLNNDGDAMDTGEQSMFVSGSMGLTVPGLAGPVPITRDFWKMVRVLPGGKVIAFASGLSITGVFVPGSSPPVYSYAVQPEMNCWYGFTDNNGVAVPEVWFNASTLNNLPMNSAFDDPRVPLTSLFPNWDIQSASAAPTSPVRSNYARFCDVVANGGPNGEPVYYLASSYRTNAEGHFNINGQPVSGLVYRVVDTNQNQVIDVGEISLYCNISGQTCAGVPAINYLNQVLNVVTNFTGSTWGFSTDANDRVHILWENGANDGVVSLADTNQNGVIDQGEATMHYATPSGATFPSPFHPSFGPDSDDFAAIGDHLMPGPFPAGLEPVGEGCVSPTNGMKPVMEAWNGGPQVGNSALEIGILRGLPFYPGYAMGDFGIAATPWSISIYGMAPTCFCYLQTPTTIGFVLADANGVMRQATPIPLAAGLIGVQLAFQFVLYEPNAGTPLTYIVSNALRMIGQP